MYGEKMKLRMIAILPVISMVFSTATPQEREYITDQAEEILHNDEMSRVPVEIYEEYQEMARNPVNLNAATPEELEATGLFTAFQVRMITDYRDRHGPLFSLYELASIAGFRESRLKEISQYITVINGPPDHRRSASGTRVILYAGMTFPVALGQVSTDPGMAGPGMADPAYEGSPLKMSVRFKTGLGQYTGVGLAYGKDPGETGFCGLRPEYLAGYVHYRGRKILEHFILGSFRLQNGLGLIQGAGLFNTPETYYSGPVILSSLKPYTGLNESGQHRGMACRLNLYPVKMTLWLSHQSMDLSVSDPIRETGRIDWVSYRRLSGLHRTSAERSGINLGYLANAGIQVLINHRNLTIGGQFSTEISGLTDPGRDSLNIPGNPACFNAIGIHWRWHRNRFETYGEYSAGILKSSAIQTGFRYHVNDFLAGSLLFHGYGAAYRETFSSAYASGGHISNEKGLMLQLNAEPCKRVLANLSLELFGYPSPSYLTRVPSSGYRFCCTIKSAGPGKLHWRIRYLKKILQVTPAGEEQGIRMIVQNQVSKLDGRVDYMPDGMVRWQSRLVTTFVPEKPSAPGYAALQQAVIDLPDRLKCTVQFVVFNIPDWDHRIYLYEPGLYHHFDFPVYSGKGQKFTMVISLNPFKRFILEGKVTTVTYHDRDRTGSGNDTREGPRKLGAGLQLRFNL